MFYQNFGDWPEWSKSYFGPMLDLQNINNRIAGKITRQNIDTGSKNLSETVKYAQGLNKEKQADEALKKHLDFISDMTERGLEYCQNICKVFEGSTEEYKTWMKSNIPEAFQENKSTTQKK